MAARDPDHPTGRIPCPTCIAAIIVVVAIAVFEFRDQLLGDAPSADMLTTDSPAEPLIQPVDSVFARQRESEPTYPLPGFIAQQIPEGSYQTARRQLTTRAVSAVQMGERGELAHAVALLGAAALAENDLSGARVYLDEALDVYEQLGDDIGIGSVELLRSRVESVARENARDAASAQDVMQIAAWMISEQRFEEAELPLLSAIEENLRLNRFGATAAGYEMLARGYASMSDHDAANDAAAEAARLHAASGRRGKADAILHSFAEQGYAREDIDRLTDEVALAAAEFESSTAELQRARDYEYLYRRLLAAGDPVQAWLFRQKADDSLARASKRAMYRRQTGVVALLYNSNENRRAATASLQRAKDIFSATAESDVLEHIDRAAQQIW